MKWPQTEKCFPRNCDLLAGSQTLISNSLIYERLTTWNDTITVTDNKIGAQGQFRSLFRNQLSCLGAEQRRFVIGAWPEKPCNTNTWDEYAQNLVLPPWTSTTAIVCFGILLWRDLR